ncbi:MAG: hypothetical protein ACQEQR_05835 [Pseudomonadota bacterium]
MRRVFLTVTCVIVITLSACSEEAHEHTESSHFHDAPKHHDTIK